MPELPEVETVVRSISPHVTGKTIQHAALSSPRVTRGGLKETAAALKHRVINQVRRRGKQIFFDLDRGVLYVHLGMTGKLLWNGHRTPYTRAEIVLENGTLLYDDVRQFGRVEYFETAPKLIDRVGPDALSVSFGDFYARLKQHRTAIKSLLLNQAFISGVGNIYADEALFRARIHPLRPAGRLTRSDWERLRVAIEDALLAGIEAKGASIDDFRHVDGARGSFQDRFLVHLRAEEPCVRCGRPIRKIVVGGRGTYVCEHCQPRPRRGATRRAAR